MKYLREGGFMQMHDEITVFPKIVNPSPKSRQKT